jgi:hypothetical protein
MGVAVRDTEYNIPEPRLLRIMTGTKNKDGIDEFYVFPYTNTITLKEGCGRSVYQKAKDTFN